jgi:hypothetical protein
MNFTCAMLMRLNKNARSSSHLNPACVDPHSRALLKGLRCHSTLANLSDLEESPRRNRKSCLKISKLIFMYSLFYIHNLLWYNELYLVYNKLLSQFTSVSVKIAQTPVFHPCYKQGITKQIQGEF